MKNGDTLRGPRSLSSSAVSAIPDRPPIPEPIMVPVAQRSSSVAGCQSASSSAWRAAHIAKMMKSSTLRWSFGSIHWSGLKVPPVPSPRGITQAMRLVRSETSKVSIFLAPLSLLRMRFQVGSTPQPSGETMPRPVTTTRLISSTPAQHSRPTTRSRWTARPRPVRLRQHRAGTSAFRVLFEKFRSVTDGQNRLRRVIGNFTTKFFFKGHHQFDSIEAVGTEVVNEARVVDNLFGFDTKVFDHDLLNSLANLAHRSTSCLFHWTRPMTIRAIVIVKFSSQSHIVLIWPRHNRPGTGERRQAPHRQYTGFPNPAMAFFAHPLVVRLSYFPSLDYKPQIGRRYGLSPRRHEPANGSKHHHHAIDNNHQLCDIRRFVR